MSTPRSTCPICGNRQEIMYFFYFDGSDLLIANWRKIYGVATAANMFKVIYLKYEKKDFL